ncbi:MAG: hypothetical protein U0625_12690 [Phycisphaerales bacterium]
MKERASNTANPDRPAPVPIGPRLLQPQTLNHYAEHPPLREAILGTMEECRSTRRRFPHTLFTGVADTGKRSLAHAIAAEFAAQVLVVDMPTVTGSEELHATFSAARPGGFIVLSGLDACSPAALRDLARGASRVPLTDHAVVRRGGFFTRDDWEAECAPQHSRRRQYANFTILATTRSEIAVDAPHFAWIERRYYLARSQQSEVARLTRAFGRLGLVLEPRTIDMLAEAACISRMHTLEAVALIAEWMRAQGMASVNHDQAEQLLVQVFDYTLSPSVAAKLERSSAASTAAAESATASKTGTSADSAPPTRPAAAS